MVRLGIGDAFLYSRPCGVCIQWLLAFSVKTVIYTDSSGGFIKKRVTELRDEEDQHVTSARKHLLRLRHNN